MEWLRETDEEQQALDANGQDGAQSNGMLGGVCAADASDTPAQGASAADADICSADICSAAACTIDQGLVENFANDQCPVDMTATVPLF